MSLEPAVERARAGQEDDAPPEDPRFRQMRRLVNALLIVMILAVMAITLALVLKLRDLPSIGVAPLRAGEELISATATADRITLTLRDNADGAGRLVILDARSFKPISVVDLEE